ncbi:MAG: hypothetical protein C0412_21460 [Flavobacterium sp.]|nr:hypothetical protein [Flavobacterium sp.]
MGKKQYSVAEIDSLLIIRDVGKIKLNKGKLYLFPPIGNRQISALFIGKGTFSFEPPTKIEKEQLLRFYKEGASSLEFTQAFLLFNDSTLSQLKRNLNYSVEKESNEMKSIVKNFTNYTGDFSKEYIESDIFQCLADTAKNGFFYAHMFDDQFKPFFFEINPYEEEEVRFAHRLVGTHLFNFREIICQFPSQSQMNTKTKPANSSKDFIKNEAYKIDANIEGNLDFSAIAKVQFKVLKKNLRWIYFDIYSEMIIDSIITSDNKKLEFHKSEEKSDLWVYLDRIHMLYDKVTLSIYYHSTKMIDKELSSWVYLKSEHEWYPRSGNGESALFDITYKYPSFYQLVSVGDSVSTTVNDEIVTARWVTPKPITGASFNIGCFAKEKYTEKDLPDITVLNVKEGHFSGNLLEEIPFDAQNSIRFFNYVFGECPVKNLYISETLYLHGLAFSGLIHLSWITFEYADKLGFNEIFRAHEIAHQWWGIEVDFKTYHDQWLSEAMAEYAGRWYMQAALKDNQKFFDVMEKSKKSIFENRKYLFSDGQQAGPIYLGYRTNSVNTEGDYDLIIYQKGAWVLHMLRLMMVDLNTMKEDRFINMMRDFYSYYRGLEATTEDFQRIVEKHIHNKMDWFFKQWIYGTDLPKYKFAYKVDKSSDGKCILRYKVKLENVSNDFVMPIIMKIQFPENKYSYISKTIDHNTKEFQLNLPMEPEEVIFNDLESVLGDVEIVDYDEI